MTRGSVRPALHLGLVGRDRELAELCGALDDASRGQGRVWLLGGEPGIGKTLAHPGGELHVLSVAGKGSARERAAVGGDAGAMLDATAKAAYGPRLAELEAEADEVDATCDLARTEKVAASATERARQSVPRAVRGTMARLGQAHADLGAHLATTVRTGVYCAYASDPRVPITWEGS